MGGGTPSPQWLPGRHTIAGISPRIALHNGSRLSSRPVRVFKPLIPALFTRIVYTLGGRMEIKPILQAEDRIEALKRLRDRLALSLDNPMTSNRDLAPLAKTYAETLEQIEEVEPSRQKEATALDELNQRRAERGLSGARTTDAAARRVN